ncbi:MULTISPECIES: tail fiber domain-containing protein [unclassified Stenotrophomonas maltophilia group]|uniref:tail fiber domain-containing protein n=1 Tax=unclassified Stenotrophomonas maltophilia group TaxID=2961925 RepID=UPI003BF7B710
MPVPNSMADLSTLASSNFPTGTESIGNNLDNYLRSHAAIIRSTNAIASATIASASTTDIALADGESVQITGTANINSFGTGFVGCYRELRFTQGATIKASGSILLPNGEDIVTVANEVYSFRCIVAGAWSLTSGVRDSGAFRKSGGTLTGRAFATGRVGAIEGGPGPDPTGKVAVLQMNSGASFGLLYSFDYATSSYMPMRIQGTQVQLEAGLAIISEGVLPASAGGSVFHTGGYASPVTGRTIFGDGTGWQYRWARRSSGTNADVMTLDDSGNLTANNLTATSDESLKEHWDEVSPSLVDGLADLLAGTYDRKDLKQRQVGVGAQSLQKIMPEAVYGDELLSVNYGGAALVSAVALAKRLIALERRVYGAS